MTETTRSASSLVGMPVYSSGEGRHLGEVRSLLVRREDQTVMAVTIGGDTPGQGLLPGRGGRSGSGGGTSIPFSRIKRVGVDAVLLETASHLDDALPPEEVEQLDGGLSGRPVITEAGQRLGEVAGYTVDTREGRIVSYQIRIQSPLFNRMAALVRGETADLDRSVAVLLGPDVMIVNEEAVSLLQKPGGEEPRARASA